MASPSSAPMDCPEVTTKWEYIDLHHTSFTSTLPGDVVHLSLQVKTVKGMHTIHKDAWGGHSQHFRKWGTQITPTTATRYKLEKFKSQWNAFVRGSTQGRGRRNRGKKYSSYPPSMDPSPLTPTWRDRQNMPWVFKGVVAPPPTAAPSPTWTAVAEPLADMAQLSAGMLPLGRGHTPGPKELTPPTPLDEGQAEVGKGEEAPRPIPFAVARLKTSPISSCEDIPALVDNSPVDEMPLDLSVDQKKEELEQAREERKLQTLSMEKEKRELQQRILEMDIKIEKLESISLEQFKNIGNIGPPIKEEKVVRFTEPPTSPPAPREEEAMDLSPEAEHPGTPHPPPLDPEVDVIESGVYSSEEEDIKETRRTSWAKHREAAQRKRLCLRLVRNKVGFHSLEVYNIPKTPSTPPSPLFPDAVGRECQDDRKHPLED